MHEWYMHYVNHPNRCLSELSSVLLVWLACMRFDCMRFDCMRFDCMRFDWLVSMRGGLTGLYYCRYTNYHRASRLYRVLFTKPERSAKWLLAVDLSYCWLYPSKQAINCFMLFACLDRVLFSRLKCSVEQVWTADLSACLYSSFITFCKCRGIKRSA